MAKPINVALQLIGPDVGPDWDVAVEQSDGSVHHLMRIHSTDAMGVGYLFSKAALAMGVELKLVGAPSEPASEPTVGSGDEDVHPVPRD